VKVPTAGAAECFIGDFEVAAKKAVGRERMLLLANSTAVKQGQESCDIEWTLSGLQYPPTGTCAPCTYSLELTGDIDIGRTSCPPELYEGLEKFEVTYNVAVTGPDTLFYYAETGTLLGLGSRKDIRVTYVSDGSCTYFVD